MLTLLWSLLILVFSYLAATNIRWLWFVSVMIVLQYITDYYDGKVGKYMCGTQSLSPHLPDSEEDLGTGHAIQTARKRALDLVLRKTTWDQSGRTY